MKNSDQKYAIGEIISGFEVKRVVYIPSVKNDFIELEHIKTGAKYVHLLNDDSNNCFGVLLKTTPTDSTGVAHILEHTALCGSKKYPVRDPFFSMIKRSVNTFMNAFTALDWTMYPFCSQNKTDFYNLMGIYLDAVFFPELKEINFRQEGHRLELNDNKELEIKGIVYNEMKGAMSSPGRVMWNAHNKLLFPNTTYHHNSGGDPKNIPELTYEDFIAFHKRYYHPSNSYFYSYGNFDLKNHLQYTDAEVLQKFDKIDPKTSVPRETRVKGHKLATEMYQLEKSENDGKKSFVLTGWPLVDITSPKEALCMKLLSEILLGHAGAPLHKSLIESKLGKALAPLSGVDDEARELVFRAGLQGVKEGDESKVENLIKSTLKEVVKKGIEKDEIDSAIHQMEIFTKEISGDRMPYSLNLFFRFVQNWIHGGDPITALNFEEVLNDLKKDLETPKFLESQIEKYLINNEYSVTLVLNPNDRVEKDLADQLKRELTEKLSNLKEEELANINKEALELKAHQEAEEDLSVLPMVKVKDLNKLGSEIAPAAVKKDLLGAEISFYEQPTNGLVYYYLQFDLQGFSKSELPWLSLFSSVLVQSGTNESSYEEMAKKVNRYTGGISCHPDVTVTIKDQKELKNALIVSGKALVENSGKMMDIMGEYILLNDFKDMERLKTIIVKRAEALVNKISDSGHAYARKLSTRNFNKANFVNEQYSGIHQVKFMKNISVQAEKEITKISKELTRISEKLFSRKNLKICVVGDKSIFSKAEGELTSLLGKLSDSDKESSANSIENDQNFCLKEAWTFTSPVSYVVESFQAPNMKSPDSSKLAVLSNIVGMGYLHGEIREKGGAYGGMASYAPSGGYFSLVSYRDPHLKNTREVYKKTLDYINSDKLKLEDIEQGIIQTISAIDNPLSPSGEAYNDFIYNMSGSTKELRQRYREGILSCTISEIREVANKYLSQDSSVVVITSEDILERDKVSDLERIKIVEL